MQNRTIPITPQVEFISAANAYQQKKGEGVHLDEQGVCHGLSCTWLEYCMKFGAKKGTENFAQNLRMAKNFITMDPNATRTTIIESVIQKSHIYNGDDVADPTNDGRVLLSTMIQARPNMLFESSSIEFNAAFSLSTEELASLLNSAIHEKKPVLLKSSYLADGKKRGHTTAIFREDDLYYFYDSNSKDIIVLDNTEDLAKKIIERFNRLKNLSAFVFHITVMGNLRSSFVPQPRYPNDAELQTLYRHHLNNQTNCNANLIISQATWANDANAIIVLGEQNQIGQKKTADHLMWAALLNHTKAANALIQYSDSNTQIGDPCVISHLSKEMLQLLIKKNRINLTAKDDKGKTALHYAIEGNRVNVVEELLKYKKMTALLMLSDNEGIMPIEYAIQHNFTMLNVILSSGVLSPENLHYNDPPLINLAIQFGSKYSNVVKRLLQEEINPNLPDKNTGKTSLHEASESGLADIVTLLLNKGAYPLVVDKKGQTALSIAVSQAITHSQEKKYRDIVILVLKSLNDSDRSLDHLKKYINDEHLNYINENDLVPKKPFPRVRADSLSAATKSSPAATTTPTRKRSDTSTIFSKPVNTSSFPSKEEKSLKKVEGGKK